MLPEHIIWYLKKQSKSNIEERVVKSKNKKKKEKTEIIGWCFRWCNIHAHIRSLTNICTQRNIHAQIENKKTTSFSFDATLVMINERTFVSKPTASGRETVNLEEITRCAISLIPFFFGSFFLLFSLLSFLFLFSLFHFEDYSSVLSCLFFTLHYINILKLTILLC